MAEKRLYVISDLHLGGSAALRTPSGADVCFQMCPPEARRRLARFVESIGAAHPTGDAHLVINGDFVDFLAEERIEAGAGEISHFEAFTREPAHALEKLRRVIRRMDEHCPQGEQVFESLRRFVGRGHALTVLLGNHDVELSIPQVRRALLDYLTSDRPARVEFLYDGEAYDRDGVLIEHGNRYEGWNAIDYGALRAFRSRVSRGEAEFPFIPPPGSELVVSIMNPIKQRYPFIDLLKPEDEAVIPVLLALEPDLFSDIRRIARASTLAVRMRRLDLGPGRVPEKESRISAGGRPDESRDGSIEGNEDPTVQARTERILAAAALRWQSDRVPESQAAVAAGLRGSVESARSLWRIWTAAPDDRLVALRQAFVDRAEEIGAAFELGQELPRYAEAARRLSAGHKVVIFGHTHLPKRVRLDGGGLYLNTGTWCPTVRVPPEFCEPDVPRAQALPPVRDFVERLCRGDEERQLRTTFARVTVSVDRATAQLFEFLDDGSAVELGIPGGS